MGLAVGGGGGSAGGTTKAVTRLAVVDPHLVIMMRDVMDASETAARLQVGGGAGGGGGGAGEDRGAATSGTGGINGVDGVDVTNAVNVSTGAAGAAGQVSRVVPFFSAAGGLSTANTNFEFNAVIDEKFVFTVTKSFTLANGSALADSDPTLFQF